MATPEKSLCAIAWDEWLASEEGRKCADPVVLAHPQHGHFLRNRLWYAFMAGAKCAAPEGLRCLRCGWKGSEADTLWSRVEGAGPPIECDGEHPAAELSCPECLGINLRPA